MYHVLIVSQDPATLKRFTEAFKKVKEVKIVDRIIPSPAEEVQQVVLVPNENLKSHGHVVLKRFHKMKCDVVRESWLTDRPARNKSRKRWKPDHKWNYQVSTIVIS